LFIIDKLSGQSSSQKPIFSSAENSLSIINGLAVY
jgi:hypothetical protein